jgi:parallel beta-helix repeat protein
VDVWKQVTLIGDGADVVTVRAADVGDHVFNVTMDWVNIRGFTVTGVMIEYYRCKAGIYLNGVNHCNIFENNASKNCYGIHLWYSSNNTLADNIASNNRDGIHLWHSNNNTLHHHNNLINNTQNAYDTGTNT